MSHVALFETPEYVGNADGLGTLRILVQFVRFGRKTRIIKLPL
jgi:GDPmannose 4,6-dehydratase